LSTAAPENASSPSRGVVPGDGRRSGSGVGSASGVGGSAFLPPPSPPPGLGSAADPGRGMSYRASLILSLSLLVLATGLVVSLLSFRGARAGTAELANALFHEVSDHAVTKTRSFLQRASPISQALGDLSGMGFDVDGDRDTLGRQFLVILRANRGLSWISYSDEQGRFVGAYRSAQGTLRINQSHIEGGRTHVVEHDVMPDGSFQLFRKDDDSGFDPRLRPYYKRAREAGRVVWTPPYIFYDQGVPGVTCANPLYDQAGRLRGVFTVDFDLDTLSQFVEEVNPSDNASVLITTADGTVLAYRGHKPLPAVARGGPGSRGQGELRKANDLGVPIVAAFNTQLGPEDRTSGPNGADRARPFTFEFGGEQYFARTTSFTIDGDLVWLVGVMAPQSDFLAGVSRTTAVAALTSLAAMVVAVVVATLLARRVSGPIVALVRFMEHVGNGNLTARPRLGGAREFRQLSDALDRMLQDLRDRTRLRSAMGVAKEVQQGLLPVAPPRVDGLDVYGFSEYCDETGGDYFDYLVLDLPRPSDGGRRPSGGGPGLLVAIGDVVGHGIGSAIFMAGARAILHSRASACGHLGELMTHLNDQLVTDTGGRRFVTMLLWHVDRTRGTACWANAGHDPVLVYDPQLNAFTDVGREGDIPLGIERGVNYAEHGFNPIRTGQVIVLGTDGVWETVNAVGEPYGRQRLMEVVRALASGTAQQIATAVRRDVEAFRGDHHQRDDVTLVVIKVVPTGSTIADAP